MHVTKIQQRNYKKLYALSTVRENKKYAKRSNLEDQIETKKKIAKKNIDGENFPLPKDCYKP